jgi:ATP-binding protein involved in chromosome partitioning
MSRLDTRGVDVPSVRAAVGAVVEPVTGWTLDALGAIGTVSARRRGHTTVPVALPTPPEETRAWLATTVITAARAVPGVTDVEIEFSLMDQRARTELARRMRAGSPPPGATRRIYAVASGKGGVGKSTVTANLAAALAAAGQRVGLLDADVWGYSVPQLFGIRRSPVALCGVMLPLRAYGVALMSTGFFVDDNEPVVWRGPMLHKALEQFLADVLWGELDVLLLDLPPGTGDITLSLLELVPDAALLAITTPQAAACSVASRVARMAREAGMAVAGVVENMTAAVCGACGHHTPLFGSGGGLQLSQQAEAPLLGQIPLDLALREAGDRGVPVVLDQPDTPAARELAQIAANLPTVHRSLVGRALPLSVIPTPAEPG